MGALGRPRRSCLAVPASSGKMLDKARDLGADQVFLDLEDAVAPLAKPQARKNAVAALTEGGWGGKIRAACRSAASASRRRSRPPADWPMWTLSWRPRRGWRPSSSGRPT
jgi:hypothetical protein